MTTAFDTLQARLKQQPRTWVVTGVAGFIGSNLLESLLALGQRVVGLDNYATGHRRNLELVRAAVGPEAWGRFHMIEGDICDANACRTACEGADYVLHQAALGSVPRSIEEPAATNAANVDGFLNMLVAAREAKARRFVYASSSSLYGDHPGLPKVEDQIGEPLSPYAVTKLVNELYASVFGRCYGTQTVGLRYFNIFGPRQDPEGAYAAVIPQWVAGFLRGEPVYINGDGETSRDFCYVANAVQANLLAATADADRAANQTYNIAVHERTTLNRLFTLIRDELTHYHPEVSGAQPVYRDFRAGDVRHSLADISKAQQGLGYAPTHLLADGLNAAMRWYVDDFAGKHAG